MCHKITSQWCHITNTMSQNTGNSTLYNTVPKVATKKTSSVCTTGHVWGKFNAVVLTKMASNQVIVSMSWRYNRWLLTKYTVLMTYNWTLTMCIYTWFMFRSKMPNHVFLKYEETPPNALIPFQGYICKMKFYMQCNYSVYIKTDHDIFVQLKLHTEFIFTV